MISCEVCGGENFETHAGFMYCSICQTQSQEFHEQEYDYREANTTKRIKSKKVRKNEKREKTHDDGFWTSWEAFNYILHGMTQEVKKIESRTNFEFLVLKLWAAYLRECKVAFTSKTTEKMPKLSFNFKQRDARVLFSVDTSSYARSERRKRRERSKSVASFFTSDSSLSLSSMSLARKKQKLVAKEYEEQCSLGSLSNSNLADETLESLGQSSESLTDESPEGTQEVLQNFKGILGKNDFKLYKYSCYSSKLKMKFKKNTSRDVRFMGKNKLLSILHLALLLSGSEIQLSDLLRFIREGHISFAKVTQFLPDDVKFSQTDFSYIDVTSDSSMPTHLRQRKITSQVARLLRIEAIPTPNMVSLVCRYCRDLNLPNQIAELSKKIVLSFVPLSTIPRAKTLLPSYEAWGVAAIIFVLKLLFGLDGETELVLSEFARKVNSAKKPGEETLFVFGDWQKFQELRKTVLTEHHYPTLEQLDDNSCESSKRFLDVLTKESKDEHRSKRFIPYSSYYIGETLISGVKEMLRELTKPQHLQFTDFPPSLTPQTSYAETIISKSENVDSFSEILTQNFEQCDVLFSLNPDLYLKSSQNFKGPSSGTSIKNESSGKPLNFPPLYWTVQYSNLRSGQLENFKFNVLEKTSETFQWVITECARMVEMNVRDVYDELLRIESKFRCNFL